MGMAIHVDCGAQPFNGYAPVCLISRVHLSPLPDMNRHTQFVRRLADPVFRTTVQDSVGRLAWQSELLPHLEPWIRGAHLVMPTICGLAVGYREGSGVRQRVNALQQLDFGDSLFGVHATRF